MLVMSMIFYHFAAVDYTILFLLFSTFTAWMATNLLQWMVKSNSTSARKWVTAITVGAVFFNFCAWFLLKGSSFWITTSRFINGYISTFPILSVLPVAGALGMGYYTAQVIGYIIDCYWENVKPQKNFLKLFLFVSFFPQLTVGPISKYSQLECLYEKHSFSYQNLCFGCQRILWGMFKKIVVSDRIRILTSAIWNNQAYYVGFWPWIAVLLYPLQLYTDFSGCMDIVLGAAELFDIHLPENFCNPFFSRNIQEFWQRWHMSLGNWARDYVYYPVLKSRMIQYVRKLAKKHFKMRIAKFIPWALGMAVLWFVMGFWHGAIQYIVGVSAWFWFILVIGEFFAPLSKKVTDIFHIDTECFSWHLVQSMRTYVLCALGILAFVCSGLKEIVSRYGVLIRALKNLNPWIFFDGSIVDLGVSYQDINIILFGVFMLIVVAVLRERNGFARIWMYKQILPFRWFVWLSLFAIVLVYGLYGPGYDAAAFVYEGF